MATFYRHAPQQDITKLDFFDLEFEFTCLKDLTFYCTNRSGVSVQEVIEQSNADETNGPPIWLQADRLAKAIFSAVMTDLGQTTLPRSSNIVADADTLQFPILHNHSRIIGVPGLQSKIPKGTFDDFRVTDGFGPLEVTPSIISTNYLCSVPRRKSIGNLIMSILLADIVLLSTAWHVYGMVVGWLFIRDPKANYCDGCRSGMHELQPLSPASKSRPSSMQQLLSPVSRSRPSSISRLSSLDASGHIATSSSTRYGPVHLGRANSTDNLMQPAEQA